MIQLIFSREPTYLRLSAWLVVVVVGKGCRCIRAGRVDGGQSRIRGHSGGRTATHRHTGTGGRGIFHHILNVLTRLLQSSYITTLSSRYRKNPENLDTHDNSCNYPKIQTSKRCRQNNKHCRSWSDCSLGAVLSGSTQFALTCLSETLGSLNW